jgi:hypothetical protein
VTDASFPGLKIEAGAPHGVLGKANQCQKRMGTHKIPVEMANNKDKTFEVACPDCGAMLKIDGATGLVVSHTPAPRKRMFEDLETAAKAMREHGERTESIFRQSVDAEKNKADLLEKRFAEAMRKAKDAPDEGKPFREIDLD